MAVERGGLLTRLYVPQGAVRGGCFLSRVGCLGGMFWVLYRDVLRGWVGCFGQVGGVLM